MERTRRRRYKWIINKWLVLKILKMKIAVLVDLELTEKSGGHVKYWLRISDSIKRSKLPFSITIFFLGQKKKDIRV